MIDRSTSRKAAATPHGSTATQARKPTAPGALPFQVRGPSVAAGEAKPSAGPSTVQRTLEQLEQRRRSIDHLLGQAARGKDFSPTQLLHLQATVYRYAQDLEVLSRVVDRTVGALKTTLNTQL